MHSGLISFHSATGRATLCSVCSVRWKISPSAHHCSPDSPSMLPNAGRSGSNTPISRACPGATGIRWVKGSGSNFPTVASQARAALLNATYIYSSGCSSALLSCSHAHHIPSITFKRLLRYATHIIFSPRVPVALQVN